MPEVTFRADSLEELRRQMREWLGANEALGQAWDATFERERCPATKKRPSGWVNAGEYERCWWTVGHVGTLNHRFYEAATSTLKEHRRNARTAPFVGPWETGTSYR